MGVGGRGQREVSEILFRVSGLLQRAQHQVTEDSLFRFARNLFCELLIHARGDVDFFGDLDLADALAGAVGGAAVGFHLHALDGQRADAERVSESGGDGFEVVDALGIGLLVDAVEDGDALRLEMVRDASRLPRA